MLSELYNKHRDAIVSVRETFPDEDLEGPLLMRLDSYWNQPVKLLIIGQETGGWGCDYDNFDAQYDLYKKFNMGETYKSTPFWNITRKIENIIGIPSCSCAWTNLSRFDHNGGEPKGEILDKIRSLDFLVSREIEILNPDICMFFTNRKYDYRIKALFPGIKMSNVESLPYNHFVKLEHPSLPTSSFRTPHPKTIRIQKWEDDFLRTMRKILPNHHLHSIANPPGDPVKAQAAQSEV